MARSGKTIEILLVEDNPCDVRLAQEAMKGTRLVNSLMVVPDGVEAMAYLRAEGRYSGSGRPDLILLDLNLPRMDGREVLEELKKDDNLKRIPVVVMTSSEAEQDIVHAYNLHANCYIAKPVDFDSFTKIVRTIEQFWFTVVKLPSQV